MWENGPGRSRAAPDRGSASRREDECRVAFKLISRSDLQATRSGNALRRFRGSLRLWQK